MFGKVLNINLDDKRMTLTLDCSGHVREYEVDSTCKLPASLKVGSRIEFSGQPIVSIKLA